MSVLLEIPYRIFFTLSYRAGMTSWLSAQWQIQLAEGRTWISACSFHVSWMFWVKFSRAIEYNHAMPLYVVLSENRCSGNHTLSKGVNDVSYTFLPLCLKFGTRIVYRNLLSRWEFCEKDTVLRGVIDFYRYFRYFFPILGEIRYKKSEHNAVELCWVSSKSEQRRTCFFLWIIN